MRRHVIEMDVARALATIAVIVIHISATPLAANPRGGWAALAYLIMNVGARFAVPAFVLLSGAGLSLSNKDKEGYFSFLGSRLSKIVPEYLVWTVIYTFVVDLGSGTLGLHSFYSRAFLKSILTGGAFYHLYFVPLIVVLYLLFPLIHNAMKTTAGLVVCTLLTLAHICIGQFVGYPPSLHILSMAINPLNWLFYLAMGVWFAKPEVIDSLTSNRFRHLSTAAFVLWMGAMVGLARSIILSNGDVGASLGIITLPMVPYTVLFFIWVYKQKWTGRLLVWLRWISRNSFAIYLAHPLVLRVFYANIYGPIGQRPSIAPGLAGLAVGLGVTSLLIAISSKVKHLAPKH